MNHVEASGLDNMGLLQGAGGNKQGPTTSSNYDDAMQFVKKRRYLHAVNNDYGAASLHMAPQGSSVIQGSLGPEPTLAMLDTSPLELKHDKSGIPDEVLQSLLDHYSHKPEGTHHHDVTFDLSDHPHHVDLQPAAPVTPELEDDSPNGGDKTAVMSEYSKFLLQALERTSHSGPFPSLGPTGPFPLLSSGSSPTGPLFSDKHVYTTSPLDCGYPPTVSSPLPIVAPSSTSSSSSSKSHYGMLVGSPSQTGYHLSMESTSHQQLTPSQELTEQLEKQHSPSAFNLPPQDLTAPAEVPKGQQPKAGGSAAPTNGSSYPDLSPLNPPKETTYQIENFAQAFGSQFKTGRRTPLSYGSDPGAEVDHRIRTPVSEFSGLVSPLEAKVFPGQLNMSKMEYNEKMADKSSPEFKNASEHIIGELDTVFKSVGYSGSIVLEIKPRSTRKVWSRAQNGVTAVVDIIFTASANITAKDIETKITGCQCDLGGFEEGNLCNTKTCDEVSTECTVKEGSYNCACKENYIQTGFSSRMCFATKLTLVIVGSVLGGLLLITLILLPIMALKPLKKSAKKNKNADTWKNDISHIPAKSPMVNSSFAGSQLNGSANAFANAGMPKIPRAAPTSSWDSRTNLEMMPSNSRQNLVTAGKSARLYDDLDDMSPYAQTRPQSSLYAQARPQNNPYSQNRAQINPYASSQGQTNPYYQHDDGRRY
ncbi:hypothetical protein L3Q82_001020 [Scortum barcoo]|uniref:Uncharacterized protein n=1 Tax=Scortum barcoo TaxID=214431 RepID=A0ACB8WAP2_9TELE|nr:hypothetical protein L3Q82_001020 [Scortum barcoo]